MPQKGDKGPGKGDSAEKPWVRLTVLAAAGSQLGVVLGASAFIGALADDHFGTTPWLFLLFMGGGFFGGFWNLLNILKRYGPKRDGDAANDTGPGKDDPGP